MNNFFEPTSKRQRTSPDWLLHLDEHGWAVVPQVVSSERNTHYSDAMWSWLESLAPAVKRDRPETWTAQNWPPYMRGIMQHWRVGHAPFVWEARQEPSVLKVFEAIWDTDDLIVSFDGVCISKRPPRSRSLQQQDWSHIDQGSRRRGRQAVQGLLTLTEAGAGRGGLHVLERSHELHDRFFETFPGAVGTPGDKRNWVKLTDEQRKWYLDNGASLVQPAAPPGSLILWDSRCVHWASAPETTPYRAAIYLCYVPRQHATDKDLKRRREIFEQRRMTSHWPTPPRLFAQNPQTWGDETILKRFPAQPAIADNDVTPLIKQLVGY